MVTLSDNRRALTMKKTEADNLSDEIAKIQLRLEQVTIKTEREIQALKDRLKIEQAPLNEEIAEKMQLLDAYINAHKDAFDTVRHRKTAMAKYGVRAVKNVKISDPDAIASYSDEQHLALYSTEIKVDKTAVKKAIEEGHDVPGAQLVSGERVFCDPDKKLLDEVRK